MKRFFSFFVLTLTILCSGKAMSHDSGKRGPHGGCVKQSGAYVVELVLQDNNVVVYLLDETSHIVNSHAVRVSIVFMNKQFRFNKPIIMQRYGTSYHLSTIEKCPDHIVVWIRLANTRILTVFSKKELLKI